MRKREEDNVRAQNKLKQNQLKLLQVTRLMTI